MARDREHYRTLSDAAILEEGRYYGIDEELAVVLAERLEARGTWGRSYVSTQSAGGRYFFKKERMHVQG